MHLRWCRLAAKATCLLGHFSRLSGHSEQACDTEAGNGLAEKDTISHDDSMGSSSIISQKTLTSTTPPSLTGDANMDFTPIQSQGRSTDRRHPSCRILSSRLRHFLAELLKPIPIVIAVSVAIALVDPLKALFLPPSGSFQPRFRPVAPDGQPPLAFVLDTASFVGAASVPIGLICLGSALACLRLRSGEAFPRGAITALALARMVVTPLIGVGITRWFARAGFVDRDDKVLQFVCMCASLACGVDLRFADVWICARSLFSCLPSATTQVSWASFPFPLWYQFGPCVLIRFRRSTLRKYTRLLAPRNIFQHS